MSYVKSKNISVYFEQISKIIFVYNDFFIKCYFIKYVIIKQTNIVIKI